MKDKHLRAAAQVENVRRWTERETLARAKESQRSPLRQPRSVMDNLDRALAQPADMASLYQGVQMTRSCSWKKFWQMRVSRGAGRTRPALTLTTAGSEVRSGDVDEPTIAEVVMPGYIHEDELLRPAKVVVVR